jgi:hypothetical protein
MHDAITSVYNSERWAILATTDDGKGYLEVLIFVKILSEKITIERQ